MNKKFPIFICSDRLIIVNSKLLEPNSFIVACNSVDQSIEDAVKTLCTQHPNFIFSLSPNTRLSSAPQQKKIESRERDIDPPRISVFLLENLCFSRTKFVLIVDFLPFFS